MTQPQETAQLPALTAQSEITPTQEISTNNGYAGIARVENGLTAHIDGVHLGRMLTEDGWNAGFVDASETPVPNAGLSFIVKQSSAGNTVIAAKPLAGFKVEALDMAERADGADQGPRWTGPQFDDETVTVTYDTGNMSAIEKTGKDWSNVAEFGNPGARVGVVRVTNPDGQVRHFALGADFQGEPDDWQVNGAIAEVTFPQPQELPNATPPELSA